MTMKKCLWSSFFFIILSMCSLTIDVQAEGLLNTGVVVRDTQMYEAANDKAECMGSVRKGSRVKIISILSHFILIKHGDIYAYLPFSDVQLDTDYEKQLGHPIPYISPYEILVTEGRIREQAADIMIKAYIKVSEKVRRVFEEQGFRIKMTEWDVTEEAYAPYGGYQGIGKVKAVFDYERKILFVNDEWPEEIVHEMGHFVNDYLNMYSSLPENRELYRTECSKISYYAEENDREFFAEAFRLYVFEPTLLQLISSKTFFMVDNVIQKFS